MASAQETDNQNQPPKGHRPRSPNHPAYSLSDAIEKAKSIYDKFGRHSVPIAVACSTWGFANAKSSSALQSLAAVKAYGLADVTGMGDSQKLTLTNAGERIVRNAPDRGELLKTAILTPPIHKEVLDHFKGELPPDELVKQYLVWERPKGSRFTDEAVDGFIERFRSGLRYAGLISDGNAPTAENNAATLDSSENGSDPEASRREVWVGSLVQWTSNGVDQFPQPRKVLGKDGDWAFVEGSPTGIPMSELTVIDLPRSSELSPPPVNPFHAKGLAGAATSQSRMSGFSTISLQVGDSQEFPLYTSSGKGTLSVPAQMSKKAFELLKRQIENSLSVIEATAVVADEQDGG